MISKSSSISYIDFLWTLSSIFLIILLVQKNIDDKNKANVLDPSEFIVELTWADNSQNDVDLLIGNPLGEILSFKDKMIGGMMLDTDNTGTNTAMKDINGDYAIVPIRREVGSIRKTISGKYIVNTKMFENRTGEQEKIKVSIKKLNPYQIITEKEIVLNNTGEEVTISSFYIDDKNYVISKDDDTTINLSEGIK